jgi:hypothetical protein
MGNTRFLEMVNQDLEEISNKAGLPRSKTHSFRSNYIVNKLKEGIELKTLAKELGFVGTRNLEGYICFLNEEED